MFTGIVRALGTVKSIRPHGDGGDGGDGCTLVLDLGALDEHAIHIGDSLAVNGACLTVSALHDGAATFSISPETMARCLVGQWSVGERLNLEPALTLQTPVGGHLVSGHIDDTGTLIARFDADTFIRMELEVKRAVGRLIAAKGAVAVDGVSLTINNVDDVSDDGSDDDARTRFTVMLVPHTLQHTNLGATQPGACVHIEVDSMARYVHRWLETSEQANGK